MRSLSQEVGREPLARAVVQRALRARRRHAAEVGAGTLATLYPAPLLNDGGDEDAASADNLLVRALEARLGAAFTREEHVR